MNQTDKLNKPEDLMSLASAMKAGLLCRVDTKTLARSISFSAPTIPADIRRCADAILDRVISYYDVIEYEGPDYAFNKPSSLYPAARGTAFFYDRPNNNWLLPRLACGGGADQQKLYEGAGALSLDAAFYVAAHELQQFVPECADCLRQGVFVLRAALYDRNLSGVNWVQSCRRIKTKGARKILTRIRSERVAACLGVATDSRPAITPEGFPASHIQEVETSRATNHA
tara:strand:- start:13484 stop:14167 length:684 start_codon:yes stop_codon:yes gene_type:complete